MLDLPKSTPGLTLTEPEREAFTGKLESALDVAAFDIVFRAYGVCEHLLRTASQNSKIALVRRPP
jgi:hypothetical protein